MNLAFFRAHLRFEREHHPGTIGFGFYFIQRWRLGSGHADAVTNPFWALDSLIAAFQQFSVGDAGDLGERGTRLHGLKTKLNDIAGGFMIFFVISCGFAKDRVARDIAVVAFMASAE